MASKRKSSDAGASHCRRFGPLNWGATVRLRKVRPAHSLSR